MIEYRKKVKYIIKLSQEDAETLDMILCDYENNEDSSEVRSIEELELIGEVLISLRNFLPHA